MLDENIIFNLFSIFLVISAFMVIIARSPVFSLLFLVASFIFASLILFMLECEFLALLFMVVYVGAIAILFLFAIMMLESKFEDFSKNSIEFMLIKILFYALVLILILNEINNAFKIDYYHDLLDKFQNWCNMFSSSSSTSCEGLSTEDSGLDQNADLSAEEAEKTKLDKEWEQREQERIDRIFPFVFLFAAMVLSTIVHILGKDGW